MENSEYSDVCEWNPDEDREAFLNDRFHAFAEYIVGSDGDWRLCGKCLKLERFKKYSVIKPIREAE